MISTYIQRVFVFAMFVAFVSSTHTLFAQGMMGMGSAPTDPSQGLAGLLGVSPSFSAKASTVMLDTPTSKPKSYEYGFAVRDGKTRVELDLTKGAKKADADGMRSMGMDRLVIVNDPATKTALMIYPGLKAYFVSTLPDADSSSASGTVTRAPLGNETLEGHPCAKSKVTTTAANGKVTESLVWEATDMGNFPIQTQIPTKGGGTSTTTFKEIQNTSPDADLFKASADFTKYGSMQEMIMGSMSRMMQR